MDLEKLNKQHSYINLATTRKNGMLVRTPVWFTVLGDAIYVTTIKYSGKAKRIANFPTVQFAPCDARGNLRGDWAEGTASILGSDSDTTAINQAFNRKYGLMKTLFELFGGGKQTDRIFIQIKSQLLNG